MSVSSSAHPAGAGRELLAAVSVMDRLRSPGGCPWDAEQTHQTLVRYLIEECYELVQAIEDDDAAAIREELGDVLLQVLFHARVAAETPVEQGGFTIDDVASGLQDKLIRRHPHVFGDADPIGSAADQQVRWDELKRQEQGRASAVDGVAMAAPALALAAKLGARSQKYRVHAELPSGDTAAEEIFRLAYQAGAAGLDPETAVRALAREHASRMQAVEAE